MHWVSRPSDRGRKYFMQIQIYSSFVLSFFKYIRVPSCIQRYGVNVPVPAPSVIASRDDEWNNYEKIYEWHWYSPLACTGWPRLDWPPRRKVGQDASTGWPRLDPSCCSSQTLHAVAALRVSCSQLQGGRAIVAPTSPSARLDYWVARSLRRHNLGLLK